ncbi:MAG: molecular chaperone TorD family protein [Acidobacteriota bacterium]|nr:molecular chaperone TorD family protein [Acidobacteriota bacterium]
MELFRALAALAEPPRGELSRIADALGIGPLPSESEHTNLFVFQLPPYASIYLGAEGMIGGEARSLVAGFWRALGQTPPREPDHLTVLLSLYAHLRELEHGAGTDAGRHGWRRARVALLWEHLSSWLPVYLNKLAEMASPFYKQWGQLLSGALAEEMASVELPHALPLHLREAPSVIDPRTGEAGEFLQSLLSPARSGLILTRADLMRASRELELGLRAGERKFILQALISQEPRAMLEWLAAEAAAWERRHAQGQHETLASISQAWARRAGETAALLTELTPSAND